MNVSQRAYQSPAKNSSLRVPAQKMGTYTKNIVTKNVKLDIARIMTDILLGNWTDVTQFEWSREG